TRVKPATIRLELANDLHRANLRCASHSSRRETRRERVKPIEPITQSRSQTRLKMLHVRITFDVHQIINLHRSVIRNPPKIVAPEIDEHHVLSDLFLVRFQVFAEHPIFRLGRATFSRARDGTIVESLSMTTHEHLRRSAH